MSTKRPHSFSRGKLAFSREMAFFPHQPLVRALEACVCAGVDVGKNLASFLLQLPPGQNFPRVPDNVEFHQGEGSAGM